MQKSFFSAVIEAAKFPDFNHSILIIQCALGQKDGGDAGVFFSGDEYEDIEDQWTAKSFEEKKRVLLPYIAHELSMNVTEEEQEESATPPNHIQGVIDRLEAYTLENKRNQEWYTVAITDLANTFNRAELINYLATTDPNGTYTDKDSAANDMQPMTIEDAREVFIRQTVNAIF